MAADAEPRRQLAQETIAHLESLLARERAQQRERNLLAERERNLLAERERAERELAERERAERERERAERERKQRAQRERRQPRAAAEIGGTKPTVLVIPRLRRAQPRSRALAWTGLAVGIAGVTGLGLAWSAAREAQDAERQLEMVAATSQPWDQPQQDTFERGARARTWALAWTIAGGVAVAGGLVLYLWGRAVRVATTGHDIAIATRF